MLGAWKEVDEKIGPGRVEERVEGIASMLPDQRPDVPSRIWSFLLCFILQIYQQQARTHCNIVCGTAKGGFFLLLPGWIQKRSPRPFLLRGQAS